MTKWWQFFASNRDLKWPIISSVHNGNVVSTQKLIKHILMHTSWERREAILVVVTVTHIARAGMISIMLASIPSRLEHTFDHINQIPDTDSNTISPKYPQNWSRKMFGNCKKARIIKAVLYANLIATHRKVYNINFTSYKMLDKCFYSKWIAFHAQ